LPKEVVGRIPFLFKKCRDFPDRSENLSLFPF